MKLRIATPQGKGFMTGQLADIFLDDVDVGRFVSRLVLTVDAQDVIVAEITLALTGVDADVAALIDVAVDEAAAARNAPKAP